MTALELAGKVAIVTGGASGIGEATVLRLAAEGAGVAVLDRDVDGARRVADAVVSAGRSAIVVPIDLGESGLIAGAVADVLAEFGRIDILVNNAVNPALTPPGTLLGLTEETWDDVYAVNVKAPFLLMKLVGQHMVDRGKGGRIVNVISTGAFRARARPAYGSSKAALWQLTRTAAAELGPHGITVNAVAPGMTRTPVAIATHGNEALELSVQGEGSRSNLLGRVAEPEDVASAIAYLCRPEALHITAETIQVSAGQAL